MHIADALVPYLANGGFHSTQYLAHQFKVTADIITQAMQTLEQWGLNIITCSQRGYGLAAPIELLDPTLLHTDFNAQTAAFIQQLHLLNVVPSTNTYLLEALPNLPSGTVCLAEAQTAGRGQHKRQWLSPYAANIYLSLYCVLDKPVAQLAGLTLVLGLAVIASIAEIALPLPAGLGIKWPNDIWINGKKLAGILVESINLPANAKTQVVIGIGLNLQAPLLQDSSEVGIGLNTVLAQPVARNLVIATLLNHLVMYLKQFEQHGVKKFLPLWAQYDILKDKLITFNEGIANMPQQAVAKGISPQGALWIEQNGRYRTLTSGEVTVVRPKACNY
jgi:BirA family biotin operon repressor/biotin-[acetyl-CoA-carboxylase] ligase